MRILAVEHGDLAGEGGHNMEGQGDDSLWAMEESLRMLVPISS